MSFFLEWLLESLNSELFWISKRERGPWIHPFSGWFKELFEILFFFPWAIKRCSNWLFLWLLLFLFYKVSLFYLPLFLLILRMKLMTLDPVFSLSYLTYLRKLTKWSTSSFTSSGFNGRYLENYEKTVFDIVLCIFTCFKLESCNCNCNYEKLDFLDFFILGKFEKSKVFDFSDFLEEEKLGEAVPENLDKYFFLEFA